MALPLWQQLIDLVELQKRQAQLEGEQRILAGQIQEKRTQIASITTAEVAKKEHLKGLKKQIDSLELQNNELDAQEQVKKDAIAHAASSKEYGALERELLALGSVRKDLEEQLLGAWHEHESAQKELSTFHTASDQQVQLREDEVVVLEKKIETLQEEIDTLKTEQQSKAAQLPDEWRHRYESMKGKVDNPIVPLYDAACSACFYMVLPKDLTSIRRGALVPCRSCYRYLYDPAHAQEVS